jgi:hypothetical protein
MAISSIPILQEACLFFNSPEPTSQVTESGLKAFELAQVGNPFGECCDPL